MCTCIYHQNTILALDALYSHAPTIPIYSREFPASCLVDPTADSCWYRECEHSNCGFQYVYCLPEDNDLKEAHAKWFRWEEINGRTIKNEQSGTVSELYKYTENVVKPFLPHCFLKRKQEESYGLDKAEAQKPTLTMMLHSDVSNGQSLDKSGRFYVPVGHLIIKI